MKKSQEEKDLLQQIVQLHEVTSIKKSMIILLVLWVVAGVFLLFFVVPLGIIFLILTPLLSQEKNRVTYQLRCSKCGAVVGMAKTCFLNPSQKKFETTKCPICKQYFSTALQLVRG